MRAAPGIVGVAALVSIAAGPLVEAQQRGGVVIENPPGSSAIFVCGSDEVLPNPIPLRDTTLVLAGDGRLLVPCPSGVHASDHRELRELALIRAGLRSMVSGERWRAAQAIARLPRYSFPTITVVSRTGSKFTAIGTSVDDLLGEMVKTAVVDPACSSEAQTIGGIREPRRWQPGILFQLLDDPSPDVQREAAYGIGKRISVAGKPAELYAAVFKELRICATRTQTQTTDDVRGLLLEAVGLAAYGDDEDRNAAETFLVQQSQGSLETILGAARGLEALVRGNAKRPIQDVARARLRELAVSGQVAGQPVGSDPRATIRMLAVQTLVTAGESDPAFLQRAAEDDDWQVRRLIAPRLDPSNRDHEPIAELLRADSAFQVRYDLVSSFARFATRTRTCDPLAPFLKDSAPVVVMRALDSLPATCTDLEPLLPLLTTMADDLDGAARGGYSSWHIPARALAALARIEPDEARTRLETATKNAIWQVRAAAVAVATTLRQSAVVEALARDEHPNVRTAALDALFRSKNAAVVPLAIDALQYADDFQLLMTAARVLRGLPAEAKDDATGALLGALRRLTDDASDMSRDPRVAILERLGETMSVPQSADLVPYVADFDDDVAEAAVKALTAVVGSAPDAAAKRRRYPAQPLEQELRLLPGAARIILDDGFIELVLLRDVAPVTVAVFAQLARSGAYNGKTLHRVAPNFVVQGGSAGGNEYSGVSQRFMRDEVGPQARHIRGAVGISTRGPDTGDGQIFIDLVDSPRLDRQYTVFAHIGPTDMLRVDRMLEGATIRSIQIR